MNTGADFMVLLDSLAVVMHISLNCGSSMMVSYKLGISDSCGLNLNQIVWRPLLVEECKRAATAVNQVPNRHAAQERWMAPPHGWIKLNVDATVSFVGRCDAHFVELWVIHDGLIQAWDFGFLRIELESDCLEATRIINSLSDALAGSALVNSIKDLMARNWRVVVHHVSRVSNRATNMLVAR
ncbi:hypothetical protein GQ457_03G014560 [Hibiscus cannabinus]